MDNQSIKVPVAKTIQVCRGCDKNFIQCPSDRYSSKYSAQYYRCKDCTGDKALIRSILYSCIIS